MEQLKSKEYTSIAKLMRGFLEEIELVPYSELPSPQEIVKELKRRRYLENGITAQQLGCALLPKEASGRGVQNPTISPS